MNSSFGRDPVRRGTGEHTPHTRYLPGSSQVGHRTWVSSPCCVCVCVFSQSLSMSRYFFLRMDTWSLKSRGSSLSWEWSRGMNPNQALNDVIQVWRWAKWSGSAQRDTFEPCSGNRKQETHQMVKRHRALPLYLLGQLLVS